MMVGSSSSSLLAAGVSRARARYPSARVIGFQVAPGWNAGPELRAGEETLEVISCTSELEIRTRLVEAERSGALRVLLTSCPAKDLGTDVLARLAGRRLYTLNPWESLLERFGVRTLDPRLRSFEWLPGRLLEIATVREVALPAGGVLDLDTTWKALLSAVGFASPAPDLQELLEWSRAPGVVGDFLELPRPILEAHVARLKESGGAGGEAVLAAVLAGHGADAAPAALLCEVLLGEGAGEDPRRERVLGRFEATILGGWHLTRAAGQHWLQQAEELLSRLLAEDRSAEAEAIARRADQLAEELSFEALVERSSWLASAWDARLSAWVDELSVCLGSKSSTPSRALPELRARLGGHHLRRMHEKELLAVDSMSRLVRWLGREVAGADSLAVAAACYREEGSFVDRARSELTGVALPPGLASARTRLLERVANRREAENGLFAERFASWLEGGSVVQEIVPIERILVDLVAPIAQQGPVLLLVLDGMSLAVYRELAEDLAAGGWAELRRAGSPTELVGLALLPSVTEVCRASLLLGEIGRGAAAAEKVGFARSAALHPVTTAAEPPLLFHKGDLVAEDGSGLAPAVRQEVARAARRVVAVVLNVVDDQLPRGAQFVAEWRVGAIRPLGDLLAAAAEAGRAVVVTADHGHLVERETKLVSFAGAAARFRPVAEVGEKPGPGELLFRGARVLTPDHQLIAAWSEKLRYTMVQSGYHGGASPQELLVPLGVWMPETRELEGWALAPSALPSWWNDEAEAPVVRPPEVEKKPEIKGTPRAQSRLFEDEPQLPPIPPPDWLEKLFASPIYAGQRQLQARQDLPEAQLAALLRALDNRGGAETLSAIAQHLQLPLVRVRGLVTAAQRRLNVEGYAVLAFDVASESVVLDKELLKRQFQCGDSAR